MGLSNDTLRAICESEFQNGKSALSNVRDEQVKALKQYFLRPNGKERASYSQVQTTETRDSIEGLLPIMMDMFMQPEPPVVFLPRGADDIPQARQETLYCRHVIDVQNEGILLILKWLKDGLMTKLGYVKVFWDDQVNTEREVYKGLTEDEYQHIISDDDVEIQQVAVYAGPEGEPLYWCKVLRTTGNAQVRIISVPGERVVVASDHMDVSLQNARYCAHEEPRMKSDLIVDGFKKDVVKGLPIWTGTFTDDKDLDEHRRNLPDEAPNLNGDDWSRDMVLVREHYIRADKDGDGRVELLQVITAGEGDNGVVISVEEVDSNILIAWTPYIIPHSHAGLSQADMTMELQDAATHTLRQVMDNMNLANLPMLAVDKTRVSNPEAIAKARLGGVISTNGDPTGAVQSFGVPFVAKDSLEVMAKLDQMGERRTGLSRENIGLDAEALAKSTNFVGAGILNQSQLRAKLIATMFATTGYKELMLRIRELVMKNMEREDMLEIAGEWTPVDPRGWRKSRATQIRVGVGTVQKAERMSVLQMIVSLQEKVFAAQQGLQGPLLTAKNVYNTLSEIEQLAGHMGSDRYFSNPEKPENQPPEQDNPIEDALQLEAAKLGVEAQEKATKAQLEARKIQLQDRELDLKERELALKAKQINDNERDTAEAA